MKKKSLNIGAVPIGDGAPVSVQTMWKKPLGDNIDPVLKEIHELASYGCDIIRFSAPAIEDAEKIGKIAARSPVPVVADIHFDYRIALKAIESGVPKVRINPGNIGSRGKAEEVLRRASDEGTVIRIGINGGSLPRELRKMEDRAEAMLLAAEAEIDLIEKIGFKEVVFSLKSSDIETCVKVNRLFSGRYPYPLHLGLTESGPLIPGTVKSAIALSRLLSEGIGDTIRISLSDDPLKEVIAGVELLKALGLRKAGVRLISCPRCGRSTFDTHAFLRRVEGELLKSGKSAAIAVMGCIVNGPEEAKSADLGITGSGNEIVIFRDGAIVFKGGMEDAYTEFMNQFNALPDSG